MSGLPFYYQDFHGGLNTVNSPDLLTDDQARDLQNVQGTTAGAIVKRAGLVTFASPAAAFTSLFPSEATASLFLVGAAGTSLYSVSTAGTVTAIKTGLGTGGTRWEFVSAPVAAGQGPVYGMDGVNTPQQWTGAGSTANWTATDAGGSLPNGKYCLYANNQVFVAGTTANPSRLYWSGLGDPTAWNPANSNGSGFSDFDPNDGTSITGIGRVGPYILVCKPRKLFILVDTATATSRRLSDNVGCVAHRSIASGPEGTYFLAEDRGVYLTNGSTLTPISDVIQPTIDSISPGLRSQAVGTYFNAHYYLSLPLSSTTNDTTLDWDVALQSWWKHTFGSNQFAIWHPTTGVAGVYSAKATSAIVDQCFAPGIATDNGVAFKWRWAGPWQSPTFYRRRRFPTPFSRKRLRQVRFEGAGRVDFSLATDFTTTETLVVSDLFGTASSTSFGGSGTFSGADGSVWGGSPTFSRARVYGQGVANAFSLVFSATSLTVDSINSYTLMVSDRKDSMP